MRLELMFYAITNTLQTSPTREIILSLLWGWWTSFYIYLFPDSNGTDFMLLVAIPLIMISTFMYEEELERGSFHITKN